MEFRWDSERDEKSGYAFQKPIWTLRTREIVQHSQDNSMEKNAGHLHRYQAVQFGDGDITLKSVIWRYMTFEKFCWLIEKSLLRHTRLDQFEDPFEGAVTNAYARMRDTGELEPYFGLKEHEPWTFKSLRYRQFATCWHASEHESDAQWKLYAAGGAGIAVVSTMARLRDSVDLNPRQGILADVAYVDFENHGMRRQTGGRTVIRPGHLKRNSFEHEKEVRGIILTDLIVEGGSFTMDDAFLEKQRHLQPKFIDAKVDLKGLIQAIVVSPVAKPFIEELVRIVTERHDLDHLVRPSDLLKPPAY
jgi:hypothetical protein